MTAGCWISFESFEGGDCYGWASQFRLELRDLFYQALVSAWTEPLVPFSFEMFSDRPAGCTNLNSISAAM
jgi:hypothetical protein